MAWFRTIICGVVAGFLAVAAAAADSRPAQRTPFPAITDWSTLRIRLLRTPCLGRCPAYSVEINGDGTVVYEGEHFVAQQGVRARISEVAVRRLYDAFVRAEFFWTFDEYRSPVTDFPTTIVTLSFDGRSKTVLDYAGTFEGMPKEIAELEDAIDAAAGTRQWTGF